MDPVDDCKPGDYLVYQPWTESLCVHHTLADAEADAAEQSSDYGPTLVLAVVSNSMNHTMKDLNPCLAK
jgi:hypothetical protein